LDFAKADFEAFYLKTGRYESEAVQRDTLASFLGLNYLPEGQGFAQGLILSECLSPAFQVYLLCLQSSIYFNFCVLLTYQNGHVITHILTMWKFDPTSSDSETAGQIKETKPPGRTT
jgi:hypothetical protein